MGWRIGAGWSLINVWSYINIHTSRESGKMESNLPPTFKCKQYKAGWLNKSFWSYLLSHVELEFFFLQKIIHLIYHPEILGDAGTYKIGPWSKHWFLWGLFTVFWKYSVEIWWSGETYFFRISPKMRMQTTPPLSPSSISNDLSSCHQVRVNMFKQTETSTPINTFAAAQKALACAFSTLEKKH